MNYRHAYHAGNFADVHKHLLLRALLEALQQKSTPMAVLDTHAGAGGYALNGPEATATGEFQHGIAQLLNSNLRDPAPPLIERWLESIIEAPRSQNPLHFYPGSPLQAAAMLRPGDDLHLCELQPAETEQLRGWLGRHGQVHIHQRDGYAALKALLPPPQKRGLVLIDPPYEAQDDEYPLLQARLDESLQRWPNGVYAIWYPIKQRSRLHSFYRWLSHGQARRVLRCELLLGAADSPLRLNGSGMAILNAPWQLDQAIAPSMHYLGRHLGRDGAEAQVILDWLRQD